MPAEVSGNNTTRYLKLLLKILVTVASFWYISGKIDWHQALKTISNAHWFYLVPSLILFILSKIVSAFRLNIYFENAGISLTTSQNLRLYWLGMFYNIFLPGSISGDAYKVIRLKKEFKSSYKDTTAAVLLDRFSGMLALLFLLGGYSFIALQHLAYSTAILGASLLALVMFYLILKRFFGKFLPGFSSTFFLGFAVQGLQVVSVYMLLAAVGVSLNTSAYILIFLLSSIVSVLPLTIGGLGIREIVFLEGSKYFGLSQELAVGISLLFYLVTLLSSSAGSYYIFHDPLKKK